MSLRCKLFGHKTSSDWPGAEFLRYEGTITYDAFGTRHMHLLARCTRCEMTYTAAKLRAPPHWTIDLEAYNMSDFEKIETAKHVLLRCANQFNYYHDCHILKDPPDTAKAEVNEGFAKLCADMVEKLNA